MREREQTWLTESVYTGVLQKSVPANNRQIFLHIRNKKGQVDGFVWKSTL